MIHAQFSHFTGGISLAALRMAFEDWLINLSHNPAERAELGRKSLQMLGRQLDYALHASRGSYRPCIKPMLQDRRFAHTSWETWPFNAISQSFLLTQQWWHDAATGVRGVSKHHQDVVSFTIRQLLDMISPANFIWSNPEVLARTMQTGGANLWQGWNNLIEDAQRRQAQAPPLGTDAYQVGRDIAVTPGKVIYRNRLIELIQYEASSAKVRPEPVLLISAWIMKYYILDLSPDNSLIKYLVDQGHTVFAVSWLNPTSADRDLGMDDYLQLGVMDAIEAIGAIIPDEKIHAVGYCLGGTLLAIAAAAMAREGDERLQSLTLLASETDFRESGEIALFIDESQLAWLEAGMWDKGYLDGRQMAGAFQMLNSRDLIWSRQVREYLLGERQVFNDLMAWNADVTRMPYRMHSEYLRQLYLCNDLAEGRYQVGGRPVALADIDVPMFIVGTVRDHVAPWPSVYKMHLLSDAELTFVLTSGGHNAGVVSEPGHPRRSFQIATRAAGKRYVDPQMWRAETPLQEGSWWSAWQQWLAQRSAGRVAPPAMGGSTYTPLGLGDAPGAYVAMK